MQSAIQIRFVSTVVILQLLIGGSLCNRPRHHDSELEICQNALKEAEAKAQKGTSNQGVILFDSKSETYSSTICEGHDAHLACPNDGKMKIMEAKYGRSDFQTCPHPSIQTADCSSKTALKTINKRCNMKPSCDVTASNNFFGDPCLNTYKYLFIRYSCSGAGEILFK